LAFCIVIEFFMFHQFFDVSQNFPRFEILLDGYTYIAYDYHYYFVQRDNNFRINCDREFKITMHNVVELRTLNSIVARTLITTNWLALLAPT